MRLRLLPTLMFALAGMMTIKVGSVWNAFEVSVGSQTLAQSATEPAATPEGAAAPAEQPAAPAGEQAAAEQGAAQPAPVEGAAPAEAAGQQAATAPQAPAGEPPASELPLTEQQVSEEEAAAAAAATPEPEVKDPFDYTDEEVDVLQQLAKRREELDLRARQLDEREALIQAAEQRMDQKMAELKALQATLEELTKQHSDAQEAELKSLVKTYENMKPKAAARVFEEMDMDVLLDVAERMSERKLAPILAQVTPTRAKEITFELAQRRQLPVAE
jgi:flagellar motility protein MotE (MotC chaperone)